MSSRTRRRALALVTTVGMVAATLAAAPAATAAEQHTPEVALETGAAPAAKGSVTWKRMGSGTSQQISAVDYKGSTIAYVTSGGQIFTGPQHGPYTKHVDAPGVFFTDVALNPAGNRGIAVASGDSQLYVFNGSTWSAADLSASSVVSRGHFDNCKSSATPLSAGPVDNAELTGVAWASNTVGYVVGKRKVYDTQDHARYFLKTTDGGATWTDVQNRRDGTCLKEGSDMLYVLTTPGLVWLTPDHNNGGELLMSNDGLATVGVAGRTSAPLLAIDPKNTQRQSSAKIAAAYHAWHYTTDLWNDYIYAGRNQGHDDTKIIRHIEAAPNGWFYIVGDSGLIERTKNGTHAESLPAPKAVRSNAWHSIAFANNKRAAVAGSGGVLLVTTNANLPSPVVVPDLGSSAPVKGKGLVQQKKNRYLLRVKGTLVPPASVGQTKKACKGTVTLTVKGKKAKGKFRNVIKKNVKVKKNCTFSKKIVIKGKKAKKMAKVKKVRLVVNFRGNKVMAPTKATYKVRLVR